MKQFITLLALSTFTLAHAAQLDRLVVSNHGIHYRVAGCTVQTLKSDPQMVLTATQQYGDEAKLLSESHGIRYTINGGLTLGKLRKQQQ